MATGTSGSDNLSNINATNYGLDGNDYIFHSANSASYGEGGAGSPSPIPRSAH